MQPNNVVEPDTKPEEAPSPPEAVPPQPENPEQPSNWQYQPEEPRVEAAGPITWTASEYIEHEKPALWYVGILMIASVIAAGLYFLTKDLVSLIVVIVAAVMFVIIGARKPRTLNYSITSKGITIDKKLYPFAEFKSFDVLDEGAISSVQLLPLKRFMPPISLFYPPDQEEKVVNAIADYIPHEERGHDAIDRLMRRVRF